MGEGEQHGLAITLAVEHRLAPVTGAHRLTFELAHRQVEGAGGIEALEAEIGRRQAQPLSGKGSRQLGQGSGLTKQSPADAVERQGIEEGTHPPEKGKGPERRLESEGKNQHPERQHHREPARKQLPPPSPHECGSEIDGLPGASRPHHGGHAVKIHAPSRPEPDNPLPTPTTPSPHRNAPPPAECGWTTRRPR